MGAAGLEDICSKSKRAVTQREQRLQPQGRKTGSLKEELILRKEQGNKIPAHLTKRHWDTIT